MPASPAAVHTVEFAGADRRGATADRRQQVEVILARAEHLAPGDAFLLRQVYEHGLRIEDIARQAGLQRQQVYRRIRNLLDRMRLPLFSFVVTHAELLDRPTRRAARLVVCHGLSQRRAAAELGVSLHTIRQRLARVQALARV